MKEIPFVGLRPFRSSEADIFFGRSKDAAILGNLILTVPVLVVYAPSGTGKSSLLDAGILPIVERDPTLVPIWTNEPLSNVEGAVRFALASTGWRDQPDSESVGLAGVLGRHFNDTGRRAIVVLDQFEERLKQSEALDNFFAQIARLANTRSVAATVVISIREDYLAGLEPLMRRVSGLLDASFRVPNLSRAALTDAVYLPLRALSADVSVDPGLVDEVLTDLERETQSTDLGDGRIEAGYFQIVWLHLWEKDAGRHHHQLTRDTYQRDGGAAGILESFVARTISELLPFEAEVLRAVTRYMVLPTGAKVPMTVDDLIGLLRDDDFTNQGRELLPVSEQESIREVLKAVLDRLTSTKAPMFRRAIRGAREEFELVHDLLGLILLKWRITYEARAQDAAQRAAEEVFRPRFSSKADEFLGDLSAKLDSPEAAPVVRMITRAAKNFDQYAQELNSISKVADVIRNGEVLKSGFSAVRFLADRSNVSYEVRDAGNDRLGRILHDAFNDLRALAIAHPSREVRQALQQQAYVFIALKDALHVGYYPTRARQRRFAFPIAFAVSLALVAAGMVIAHQLIGYFWQVPAVEYLPLTLAVVGCGATLLYAVVSMYKYAETEAKGLLAGERLARVPSDQSDVVAGQAGQAPQG